MAGARVRDLVEAGTCALSGEGAHLESELLLAHVLGASRAWLRAHADDEVAAKQSAAFAALIVRRSHGEPVAYLTGTRGFHALELEVSCAVLIPRAETELLVELALARIPDDAEFRIADLGTGSGAVALAIAQERSCAHVLATDASEAALNVARENSKRLGMFNVEFALGNWYAALGDARDFDLIVANPPYIAENDQHLHEGDLRFEPRMALAAGADGLDAIRIIISGARTRLRRGAWLLLEHGFEQGAAVRSRFEQSGYREVFTARDLEQRERVTGACSGK